MKTERPRLTGHGDGVGAVELAMLNRHLQERVRDLQHEVEDLRRLRQFV